MKQFFLLTEKIVPTSKYTQIIFISTQTLLLFTMMLLQILHMKGSLIFTILIQWRIFIASSIASSTIDPIVLFLAQKMFPAKLTKIGLTTATLKYKFTFSTFLPKFWLIFSIILKSKRTFTTFIKTELVTFTSSTISSSVAYLVPIIMSLII